MVYGQHKSTNAIHSTSIGGIITAHCDTTGLVWSKSDHSWNERLTDHSTDPDKNTHLGDLIAASLDIRSLGPSPPRQRLAMLIII